MVEGRPSWVDAASQILDANHLPLLLPSRLDLGLVRREFSRGNLREEKLVELGCRTPVVEIRSVMHGAIGGVVGEGESHLAVSGRMKKARRETGSPVQPKKNPVLFG